MNGDYNTVSEGEETKITLSRAAWERARARVSQTQSISRLERMVLWRCA
jgi:hypothetical protein